MHGLELLLILLTGLLFYQLGQGSLSLAVVFYLAAGVVWFFRMRELQEFNQPPGTILLILFWPFGALSFYYDRWRFRAERYQVAWRVEEPSLLSSTKVLATFGSWEEAIEDAKRRAAQEDKRIQVHDPWANRRDPWIFKITKDGRVYRIENDGLHMSELRDGRWHRI